MILIILLMKRFATILLYFTDSGEMDGGETVFTETWPIDIPESERKNVETVRTNDLNKMHRYCYLLKLTVYFWIDNS